MQRPPGGGHNPREAQELETRFSALSAEISASLDTILARLQRAPGDEQAIAVARELVAAQHAVAHQMLLLAQRHAQPATVAPPQHRPLLQHQLAQLLPPDRHTATHSPHDGWLGNQALEPHAPHHSGRGPQDRGTHAETPTLGDLLRRHLSAPEPPQPNFGVAPNPAAYAPPRPQRPHALELAPTTLPVSNHVVWTAGEGIAPSYSDATENRPAQSAYPQLLPTGGPALAAAGDVPPATVRAKASLPAWAQQTAATRPRYGLWAGGALAATVVLLGVVLSAGRHADTPAHDQTGATPAQAAEQATEQPMPVADARAEQERAREREPEPEPEPKPVLATAPPPNPSSEPVDVAPVKPVPRAQPANPQTIATTEKPQGALLPSAQSWMDGNADSQPPPAAPPSQAAAKTKQAAAPEAVAAPVTGAIKPRNPAATGDTARQPEPKAAQKKAEVTPFKTAVVKAPQEALYAPVLVELKNADSLMVVFKDLQSRHGALSAKRAEVRPAAGPNNETWFAVLAVPAVPKAEAEAVCRAMGAEGATLRCRVVKY